MPLPQLKFILSCDIRYQNVCLVKLLRKIRHLAGTAQPLYRLLKEDTPYFYGRRNVRRRFNILKQALADAPVLAFPDFTK
jgi:hypothetical protein